MLSAEIISALINPVKGTWHGNVAYSLRGWDVRWRGLVAPTAPPHPMPSIVVLLDILCVLWTLSNEDPGEARVPPWGESSA